MVSATKAEGKTRMTGKFEKKILFNISQSDINRMTEIRLKLGLDQSE